MKSQGLRSGLNLGSAFAFGHGGVFVLQVPYLLFYPDRNRDDVPDGDPTCCSPASAWTTRIRSPTRSPGDRTAGSMAVKGAPSPRNIRGIEFQQGVWRYHPLTHKFELFCEGGGNSWGLDFDRHGNLLYSTNLGRFVMLHGVQGGYYWKSFGKHGALHNPYAYGYFDHVPHTDFQRRPRHRRRHRLSRRQLPRAFSRSLHRRRPARARSAAGTRSSRTARRSNHATVANCSWPTTPGSRRATSASDRMAASTLPTGTMANRPPGSRRRLGPQQRASLSHRLRASCR